MNGMQVKAKLWLSTSNFDRLEIHYIYKEVSWLNITKRELRILSGQCLNCIIPDKKILIN